MLYYSTNFVPIFIALFDLRVFLNKYFLVSALDRVVVHLQNRGRYCRIIYNDTIVINHYIINFMID